MNLNDLFRTNDEFIEIPLSEGASSEQSDKVRAMTVRAKELVLNLDAKVQAKFRKEFNKALSAYAKSVRGDDIRLINARLASVEEVYTKYNI